MLFTFLVDWINGIVGVSVKLLLTDELKDVRRTACINANVVYWFE
ncbi:hypothetical protein [Sphingobacterium sp. MYb382]